MPPASVATIAPPSILLLRLGHIALIATKCPALERIEAPLFTEKFVEKIRQIVNRYERLPPGGYKIAIHNTRFWLDAENMEIAAENTKLDLMNEIPYFQAKILEAAVLKEHSKTNKKRRK